jgi:hypothetical protein
MCLLQGLAGQLPRVCVCGVCYLDSAGGLSHNADGRALGALQDCCQHCPAVAEGGMHSLRLCSPLIALQAGQQTSMQ